MTKKLIEKNAAYEKEWACFFCSKRHLKNMESFQTKILMILKLVLE